MLCTLVCSPGRRSPPSSSSLTGLSGKAQVEQLICYIVEEAAEDAEKKRTFKFPFIACEVFTCEVDAILTTLVEDEELMSKLFSFLEPDHSHGNSLAGYFCKAHQEIVKKLVDLIGITSVMEGSNKDRCKEALEREERSKKFVSINEFLRPAAGEVYYGGCGRGRGRGSRVGYRGNSNNAQVPSIEDSGHFPTLGGN